MKTDLTINATSATDGKKVTNKISYVNPNITNQQAITLAQAINNLTTDSYTKTIRTDTTDCDDTSKPIRTGIVNVGSVSQDVTTQNPTITLTVPASVINAANEFDVKITDVRTLTEMPILTSDDGNIAAIGWRSVYSTLAGKLLLTTSIRVASGGAQTFTGILTLPGGNAYREQNYNLTITFEA